MQFIRKNGATSNILRVTLRDSTTGQGKTGMTSSSSGLIISTICDNEAAATAYTQAGSTIETISTLATFAAPTATKCRFKEVDATNHPGLYEIQLADARYAVSGSKTLRVTVSGFSGMLQRNIFIQLTATDIDDAVRHGMTALPNAAAEASGGLFTRGTGAGQIKQDANGRIDANVRALLDTAWLTPGTAGTPDVNVKLWNALATVELPLVPATAGRKLVVDAAGLGDANVVKAGPTGSGVAWGSGAIVAGCFAANTGMASVRSGTCQSGSGSGSLVLDSGASGTNDAYKGRMAVITGGTGVGQCALITAYTQSSKTCTITPSWPYATPDNTSTFAIMPWTDISAVSTVTTCGTVTNQLTAAQVAAGVWQTTVAGNFTAANSIGKSIMNGVALGTGLTINAYTGDTPQTGDSYARIGAAGVSLSNIPWNASWDAEVQSEVDDALIVKGLDHLVFTSVAGSDIADNSIIAKMTSKSATADWDSFDNTTDALQAIADSGGGGGGGDATEANQLAIIATLGVAGAGLTDIASVGAVAGDVAGKVLGGGVGVISNVGVNANDFEGEHLATAAMIPDVYHADIQFTVDGANSTDEYSITFFKNGIRQSSGITSPTIQVVKRADGTDLIASTSLTQIGSTGSYKKDALTTARQIAGEACLVLVSATIDAGTRTFSRVLGRDSTA